MNKASLEKQSLNENDPNQVEMVMLGAGWRLAETRLGALRKRRVAAREAARAQAWRASWTARMEAGYEAWCARHRSRKPSGARVWRPKATLNTHVTSLAAARNVVMEEVPCVSDEKYAEIDVVPSIVHLPGRSRVAPWVVLSCERAPVGWTDLPWWRDGVAMQPDFGSVSGPDVLVTGCGRKHPRVDPVKLLSDANLRVAAKRKNPSRAEVQEYKRRFGVSPCPQYTARAALVKHENPVASQIENADGRYLEPEWETYCVPKLEWCGLEGWSSPSELGVVYNYFSATVETGAMAEVTVPSGLVSKLGEFWAYKKRDADHANFLVSCDKLRNLLRGLTISAHQSHTAMLYVPMIAYNKYITAGDKVARLVTGQYVGKNTWSSMLAVGAMALASLPVAAAATSGAAAVGVVAGGSSVVALAAGAAWLWLKRPKSNKYRLILPTKVCRSDTPEEMNLTARVSMPATSELNVEKVRDAVKVVGLASDTYLPTVYADNVENQFKALEKRVLAAPPRHDPETVSHFVHWFKDNVKDILGKPKKIESINFDLWLANMRASVPVKRRLRTAKQGLIEHGIDENSVFGPEECHRATSRESFTKFEPILTGTRIKESTKASRLIQGAHPQMTCTVGPWMTALQGCMRKVLDGRSGLMFTSGKTVREVGEFVGKGFESGRKLFDDDVSAFDLSMIEPYARLEVWICQYFHCPRAVAQLMVANISTHGWTSLGWKYSVKGTRKSGDTFTSLMNSILNLAFHLYAFCMERSVSVREALLALNMAAQGDDDIGSHSGPKVDWKKWMGLLGLKATPHYYEHPARIEFCSHFLTRDSLGWTMCPKVGRILAKAGVSLRAPEGKEDGYARMTALSLRSSCASCPPLRAWCDRVLQLTEGCRPEKRIDEPWKMREDVEGVATSETWEHLNERYGYTPEMHSLFELELREMSLGVPVDSPIYNHLCSVDTDGEPDMDVRPYGLDVELKECGPDEDVKECQYFVSGPQFDNSVVVSVVDDAKHRTSVGEIYKRALLSQGIKRGTVGDVEYYVGGKWVHPAHEPLGFDIEVRPRGKGGMFAYAMGFAKPGLWAARIVGEAVVEAGVAKVVDREGTDGDVVFIDTVSMATAARRPTDGLTYWAQHLDPFTEGPMAGTPDGEDLQTVLVSMNGVTKAVKISVMQCPDVASVVMKAWGFPVENLWKLQPGQDGKLCGWADAVSPTRAVEVRAKGFGGASISRSESIMTRVANRAGVLPTSQPWMINRLDPMHDNSVHAGGYPDSNCGMSVPMLFKTTMSVTCPSALSGGQWDCNIVFFPDANIIPYQLVDRVVQGGVFQNGLVTHAPAVGSGNAGGVSMYAVATGGTQTLNTWQQGVSYVPNTIASSPFRTSVAIGGAWRLTALGLEVTNTTAELYKQGTVTCWLQPVSPPETASTITIYDSNTVAATNYFSPFDSVLMPAPPNNIAEANVLGGSRQWAAAEGCYMTARPSSDDLPTINGQCAQALYYDISSSDVGVHAPSSTVTSQDGGAFTVTSVPTTAFNPYHQMGAMFTGLSPQTSFTVNIWAFVEVFPEQLGNVLTPLANPSAPYDEQALRLYAEIIKSMPIAVMLKENGFGDWLADLAGKAVSVVSNVAGFVSRGAAAVQAGVKSWNDSKDGAAGATGGSNVLRDDGVRQDIIAERRAIAKTVARSVARATPKASVALRNQMAMDKLKARAAAAKAKRK